MKMAFLDRFTDSQIRQQIEEKLERLQLFEHEVPAVFIIHDVRDVSLVYMSKRGLEALGTTLDEITKSFKEYHSRYFNLEDAEYYAEKVANLVAQNNSDEFVTFFQQVRRSPAHEWIWHLSATKIFVRDLDGQPLLFLTLSIPVDPQSHMTPKVERLQQELDFLRKHQHVFASLTSREKEILRLIALGKNSEEIAEALHISQMTVSTH
ncbi:MAG TPA: helix-turn-helix transcriptional regulator, partial [Flavisolibacter sp.]|nr:helix-turn-helix transcriptional regulator [Flavisolibacter sp.]